jgi:hypothetical protein
MLLILLLIITAPSSATSVRDKLYYPYALKQLKYVILSEIASLMTTNCALCNTSNFVVD